MSDNVSWLFSEPEQAAEDAVLAEDWMTTGETEQLPSDGDQKGSHMT